MTAIEGRTLHHLKGQPISWDFRTWDENGTPIYLFEVWVENPENKDLPYWFREKRIGTDKDVLTEIVARFVKILTDEDYREQAMVEWGA